MFGRRSGFLLGQTAYFSGAFAVSFRECIWTSSLTQYWLDSPSSLPPSKSDPWHFPSLSARFYRRMLQECNLIKSVFHVSLYNRNATQLPLPNWVKCFFLTFLLEHCECVFLKMVVFFWKKYMAIFKGSSNMQVGMFHHFGSICFHLFDSPSPQVPFFNQNDTLLTFNNEFTLLKITNWTL